MSHRADFSHEHSIFRRLAGGALAVVGIAAIIVGGLISGVVTTVGDHPHGLLGFAVILAGLGVMYLGLRLAGVDTT